MNNIGINYKNILEMYNTQFELKSSYMLVLTYKISNTTENLNLLFNSFLPNCCILKWFIFF